MTVRDLMNFLDKCPDDERISVLFCDDNYGDLGVTIDEATYITSTEKRMCGVFLKLG